MQGERKLVRPETLDEILMARYAAGDEAAFDELFRRYEPRVYAFFAKRTGSPERAEELYQELFLRVHRARDSYDDGRPFAPWLFQIAHRLLIDDLRRAHRSHELPIDDREVRSECVGNEVQLGDRELLGRALAALSHEERYVLVSAKVDGVGYPELAASLGRSVEAVRKLASRATQRLRAAALLDILPSQSR
jgi:RNA polymerase sigma-70 factor (ECF subfamily)